MLVGHVHSHIKYRVITNCVSDYMSLLVRVAHIICNHRIFTTIIKGSVYWIAGEDG